MEIPAADERKEHPARHVFGIAGLAAFSLIIVGSFFFAAFHLRSLVENNQLAAVVSATLVSLANEGREGGQLAPLAVNSLLIAAAQAKADDMAAKGYFSHTSPDGSEPWDWIAAAGYDYAHAGENLAVNFSDSENVMRAWMESPTHRANVMSSRYTEIGIATAVGEYKGKQAIFVVQMFGTPRPAALMSAPAAPAVSIETSQEPVAAPQDEASVEAEEAFVAASTAPQEGEAVLARSADALWAGTNVSFLDRLAASPQELLRLIYIVCAIVLLGALVFVTRLEFARHHLRHGIAASFLFVLMSGLFFAADSFLFKDPLLTTIASETHFVHSAE